MPRKEQITTWEKVQAAKVAHPNCTCRLQKGMTWLQLRALGTGCTSFFVCPVLRAYREAVGVPSPDDYASGLVKETA